MSRRSVEDETPEHRKLQAWAAKDGDKRLKRQAAETPEEKAARQLSDKSCAILQT